jgi:arylsulfatase A-like enzyme
VFTHAPGRLAYQVRVPQGGRFQTAVGVLNTPVEFRATVQPANGGPTTVWAETHADPMQWAEQTIDLSSFAGQTISLTLETSATDTGTVAFWGSPTLSGTRRTDRPNVILYIIDGGGADYMSVYGYNRRTTPNLERLAAEGAVFEHAYSTSSWTGPSTTSFMTALHASVLGGRARFDPLPEQAVTMAERFHRAGYQTAVFTSNDWAGSTSNLERGVDLLRDADVRDQSTSSVDLHAAFWDWREAYPGHPYWVHFQTTDVHEPYGSPGPPFAGMFVSPGALITLRQWQERLSDDRPAIRSDAYAEHGISRVGFYTLLQGVYDQQMAHNDYQIGRLIDRLKASGEWDNTLFIVAADHSIASAMDDLGVALLDPLPPRWSDYSVAGPMFRPTITRVPLIVVWPGHIPGDRQFTDAVSMIDVLPTVLDLTGQPMPEVMQGQSLGPLLRGAEGWTPRPVILDEFAPDPATGQLQGRLEVVDGRWGASLEIGPAAADAANRRPWPLLLYDLWSDPLCLAPVNEARPDLVAKYTTFLEEQWKAHQALATQFTPGANVALTPEQLERLRTLGYIR